MVQDLAAELAGAPEEVRCTAHSLQVWVSRGNTGARQADCSVSLLRPLVVLGTAAAGS